jgi:16S rRNA (adenine1518-N6/adenine1519-N6)-dimethyltransferase
MRKRLGQHFLVSPWVIQKIIQTSEAHPEDTVLEIGPGLGALTKPLSKIVSRLIAIELDESLCQHLKTIFADAPHVQIIQADALKIDYEKLGLQKKVKVIANLPYYVATPILLHLLENRTFFSTMTLMFQKEVAERVVAQPGGKAYGYLSIVCQLWSEIEFCFTVPPEAFNPPPEVDSAVLKFTVLDEPRFKVKDLNHLLKLIKQAFSQRRKTLRNTLKSHLNLIYSPLLLDKALEELHISPHLRGEALSVEKFVLLSNYLVEQRKEFEYGDSIHVRA